MELRRETCHAAQIEKGGRRILERLGLGGKGKDPSCYRRGPLTSWTLQKSKRRQERTKREKSPGWRVGKAMSHQQPVLKPAAPQSCSCPPRGPQTCPAQPQLCCRANHGHRLNTVTVRRQLQPGKDGARGTGALCCAGSPGKPCCLRGWHRPRSHELLRGDVFSVGQESTPDVSHESDGKGGSRSHLSPAAASSPSPARVEKHTALAQHTPAGTLSSGRAPSRASRCGNTHVSLFWPNRFRREAEATQTSLALLLCSPLIIAPLLLIACAKA